MRAFPDHGRVIAMNRPHDVGVPALETAHRQWPERAKVNHLVTRGVGVRQHAREALVAGSEFVKLIASIRPRGKPFHPGIWFLARIMR